MAGGSGTRFWPLSRQALPKQFLRMAFDRSLIQQAWDRISAFIPAEQTWVVAGQTHRDLIGEHLPLLPADRLILEPCARNTAAAIGIAAHHLVSVDPEAIMLVMPADHIIQPDADFRRSVEEALKVIQNDPQQLVLFGIRPSFPATGYGYIEVGAPLGDGSPACDVTAFREKPDETTAAEYLASSKFLWNAGIFVWRAARILEALAEHERNLATDLSRLVAISDDAEFRRGWNALKSISIDYAVLEHESTVSVIPALFEWDDVGSWESLARRLESDASGNVIISGECLLRETSSTIIHASEGHVVVTSGIDDCLIVNTPGVTMVARRSDAESMRKVIEFLKSEGRDDLL